MERRKYDFTGGNADISIITPSENKVTATAPDIKMNSRAPQVPSLDEISSNAGKLARKIKRSEPVEEPQELNEGGEVDAVSTDSSSKSLNPLSPDTSEIKKQVEEAKAAKEKAKQDRWNEAVAKQKADEPRQKFQFGGSIKSAVPKEKQAYYKQTGNTLTPEGSEQYVKEYSAPSAGTPASKNTEKMIAQADKDEAEKMAKIGKVVDTAVKVATLIPTAIVGGFVDAAGEEDRDNITQGSSNGFGTKQEEKEWNERTKGSDENIKEQVADIKSLDLVGTFAEKLSALVYKYNNIGKSAGVVDVNDNDAHVGVTAQSMEEIPGLDETVKEDPETGIKGVNYEETIPTILAWAAEASEEIVTIKKAIEFQTANFNKLVEILYPIMEALNIDPEEQVETAPDEKLPAEVAMDEAMANEEEIIDEEAVQ